MPANQAEPFKLLITAEHAGNRIPDRFKARFQGARAALESHRGWDPGTRELANGLAAHFNAPVCLAPWSRLLIELNRSPHHPRLWSEFTRSLPVPDKEHLLAYIYHPHRNEVHNRIHHWAGTGHRVLHIGVHSFTPVFNGNTRATDIGLLYDPARPLEREFCQRWKSAIESADPGLTVHRNQPYLGKADGLVTWLRREFAGDRYLGIELEVNQKFPLGPRPGWDRVQRMIIATLDSAWREMH